MPQQVYFILGVLLAMAALGFGLSLSIKKHNKKMATMKKKKGRRKYMPEYKGPGKKQNNPYAKDRLKGIKAEIQDI